MPKVTSQVYIDHLIQSSHETFFEPIGHCGVCIAASRRSSPRVVIGLVATSCKVDKLNRIELDVPNIKFAVG